jgi:hypothetical protein
MWHMIGRMVRSTLPMEDMLAASRVMNVLRFRSPGFTSCQRAQNFRVQNRK